MLDIVDGPRLTERIRGLGFGAGALGNLYREIADPDAKATLRAAFDQGVKYFDTAPVVTITIADRVLVFQQGRIVADGNHEQLRETDPTYQSMIGNQLLSAV